MERVIPASELIINPDGSVFHLHIKPEMLVDNIILVGDPGRVDLVASFFDKKIHEVSSREFHTITGEYHGKPAEKAHEKILFFTHFQPDRDYHTSRFEYPDYSRAFPAPASGQCHTPHFSGQRRTDVVWHSERSLLRRRIPD